MASVLEVAASQSDYVMTRGTKVQALNHHFVLHSLEEHECCYHLTDGETEASGGRVTGNESLDFLTPCPFDGKALPVCSLGCGDRGG